MERHSVSLNILLTASLSHKLDVLSVRHHCSKARILREAIEMRTDMEDRSIPRCASGARCFVPHMHTITPSPASPDDAA
jgi:predicted DNA-binding protein